MSTLILILAGIGGLAVLSAIIFLALVLITGGKSQPDAFQVGREGNDDGR